MTNPWGQPETGFMRIQRMWRTAEDRASKERMLKDLAHQRVATQQRAINTAHRVLGVVKLES